MTLNNFYLRLSLAFFFLMLVIPTTFRAERGALLAIVTLGAAIAMLENRWRVTRTVFYWTLVMTTAGLLFMWHGAVFGAPGAHRVGTVHVVWPVLYMVFMGLLRNAETLVYFQKTIIVAVITAALMGLMLVVGGVLGYGATVMNLFASQEGVVGFYDGFIRYRLTNVPTLIYGMGFIFAILSLPPAKRVNWQGWSLLTWVALFLMMLAVLLSARRAAWLVALMMPPIIVVLMVASGQRIRTQHWVALGLLLIGLLIGVRQYFDLDLMSLVREFRNAFDFSAEQSASVRGQQAESLIDGWEQRPLLGHGLGAGATVVRSFTEPWAYELVYLALLFQTGIIGVGLYASGVLWTFAAGLRIVRQKPDSASIMLPLLAGLAGFLIANATNPYLSKFDYLWALFLPVAAINAYMLNDASPTRVSAAQASTAASSS